MGVVEPARELASDDEIFEGEVIGDDPGSSRLPAVPFERYERLLQQGQDYKTRLEERSRHMEEIRKERDRKSTRLNSSHATISYAVFCLKKKIASRIHRSSSAHSGGRC